MGNICPPQVHPITEQLRQKLTAITENRDPVYAHWVKVIPLKES